MIADYPELIAEVTQRSGVSGVANRAAMFVGLAEAALSRRLRVADMESTVTLTTDAEGRVALPDDYAAAQFVFTTSGAKIPARPLGMIQSKRPQAHGYAISGRELVASLRDTALVLSYYAKLPSLDSNNTNWLLESDPELYLNAVLFQVFTSVNDLDNARIYAGYVGELVDNLNEADRTARFSGTRITPPVAPQ